MSYFSVDGSFWTDSDVIDDFTPEDRYFYLYLLTSPHANISGCYELSMKQVASELGYSKDTVERLVDRFVNVHKTIDYNKENKEVLIHKWGKHHWTTSDKYLVALRKKVASVKTEKFRKYLESLVSAFEQSKENGVAMVWIPYQYGMDTTFLSFPYPIPSSCNEEEGVVGGEEKQAVVGLLLNDGTKYLVYQEYVDEMQSLYPAVDVEQEFRNMAAWCINNPRKRKTKSGVTRFVNTWLSDEQNRGGRKTDRRSLTFMDV